MNATLINPPALGACVHVCNHLLRGELAAVETYNQAINQFTGHPVSVTLMRMRDEHGVNAARLRANVVAMGGVPSGGSGAWGVFARAFEAAAGFFGEFVAINALMEGEAHGIAEYEAALDSPDVTSECKSLIYTELLPRLRGHLRGLHSIAA